jgi:hypothetical protein
MYQKVAKLSWTFSYSSLKKTGIPLDIYVYVWQEA